MKDGATSAYYRDMNEELPASPDMWLRTLGGLVLAIVFAALLAGLLFPAVSGPDVDRRKAEAKRQTTDLTNALKYYMIEYGKWPPITGDGLFLDEKRQGQLMRILRAQEVPNNPRRVIFFECKAATERSGKYFGGLHPKTSVLLDPWGHPYRIALDADYDDTIANPYPDDPLIQTGFIVWSPGKDGQQGAPANPRTSKGSDDILSWQ